MKSRIHIVAAFLTAVSCGWLTYCGTAAESVAPAASSAQTATPAPEMPIPESVFTIPANPSEGRNPFFPNSKSEMPKPTPKKETLDTSSLILNGISSPPRRMAMINGRTFEPGESGNVKLPNGDRLAIKCVEIRDDGATIVVGGQTRELRMRTDI